MFRFGVVGSPSLEGFKSLRDHKEVLYGDLTCKTGLNSYQALFWFDTLWAALELLGISLSDICRCAETLCFFFIIDPQPAFV